MSKGRFISFEGLDGSGKTTQITLLARWLQEQGVPHLLTREPGGTPLGNEIRQWLVGRPDLMITPLAEAFLFQADRAQHFATVIFPALEKGVHVISDRCYDSSIAYQGAARGIGTELIEQLSLLATQGRSPDLTIFLDLDPSQVQIRTRVDPGQQGSRQEQSHFDRETEQFHRRLREAYLTLAQAHSERVKVIAASQTIGQIHQEIRVLVRPLIYELSF